ncbi:MAG: hypothetical protein ABR543_02775 [Gemmatimonadaceae bacterium]
MTPDNGAYFVAAYVAAGAIYLLYATSIWWRTLRQRDRDKSTDHSN